MCVHMVFFSILTTFKSNLLHAFQFGARHTGSLPIVLVKLLYFGMACHYSIAPWYPPYQPFSGIDRAMASWHGWRVMNLFSPKLQVKKSILAIDFIWIRALRLIFSQIYITRHCLSFFRPPEFSRILCFWEFRISENFGQANIWKVKTENRKSWNTKFSKT